MICQNCGSEISESMKFCGVCGTKVIKLEKKICPSCKSEGPLTMKFCGICGYKFSTVGNASETVNTPASAIEESESVVSNTPVVESKPILNTIPVVEESKKSDPITSVEKIILDKAEMNFYEDGNVTDVLEEITPIYQAHPEDELVVPLYLEVLSQVNFERAVEKLNELKTNIIQASSLKIDLSIQCEDLPTAEKELKKAQSLWPDNAFVVSHDILYSLAVYEKFNSKEWLDKAISTVPKLESSIAETKIERSWKEKVLSLMAERQGSIARIITQDYCKQNDLYYSIAKTELSDLKEQEEDFLSQFEDIYSPCSAETLDDFLFYEQKFHDARIQVYLSLYYIDIKDYGKSLEFAQKAAEQNVPDGIALVGGHYLVAFGVNQDLEKAKEMIEKAVSMGSSYGEMLYGIMFLNGLGVEIDLTKGFEFSLKAAKKGNAEAMNSIGDCYNYGNGVEVDKEKAFEWYDKASDQGDSSAQNALGCMYYEGDYVVQDYEKAFELLTYSAEKGEPRAQFNLANMYQNGLGCEQDYEKAFELFEMSANNGNMQALNSLGIAYYQGIGVEQDFNKAFELFKQLADQGDGWALYNLGIMYCNGDGVEQDYAKAMETYEKAAELGVSDALVDIGSMYFEGAGVEQNYVTAYEIYKKASEFENIDAVNKVQEMDSYITNYKAADEGDKTAQFVMADIFYKGIGVKQDYSKAFEWYQKTIDQGDLTAYNTIGYMYANGLGVEKSIERARECYKKLVDTGSIDALFVLAQTYELQNSNYSEEAVELYKEAAELGNIKGIENFSSSQNVSYSDWEKLNILENLYKKFTDQEIRNTLNKEINNIERKGVKLPVGKHSLWEISGRVEFNMEKKGIFQRNKFVGELFVERILNKSEWHSGDAYIEVLMTKNPITDGRLGEYKLIMKSFLGSSRPNRYYGNVTRKEDFENQPDSEYPCTILTIWEKCDNDKIYLAGWYELNRK